MRKLYKILAQHPEASDKLLRMLAMPLFFDFLKDFGLSDATAQSRRRIRIIFDDTKAEKSGKHMEFIHKFFDHTKDRHIMGYNYVLMPAVSGDTAIPLSFVLWLPAQHPDHRSKNDIARDEIIRLKKACDRQRCDLGAVELLHDSAYHVQKVMNAADTAGLRAVSKADNRYKHEYEGALLKPSEIIEKIALRQWKYLEKTIIIKEL
ncbi:MAG: transposase [bacterium]|nr:transposase [bacterium]